MRRLAILLALVAPPIAAACSADPVKDPSYMLVELVASDADKVARSARVEVLDGEKSLTTLCVRLAKPEAEKPASFVLKRDAGKDAKKRVTVRVTGFEQLGGDDNADVGKEFACPPTLPPPIAPPQVLDINFCEAEARSIVFNVGAVCGCEPPDGGPKPDSGPMADGGSDADTMDDGGSDADTMDADVPEADSPEAGPSEAGAPDGGKPDGGKPDGGGGICGCDPTTVCGAGLSTSGNACPPGECCARELNSACALEPAK